MCPKCPAAHKFTDHSHHTTYVQCANPREKRKLVQTNETFLVVPIELCRGKILLGTIVYAHMPRHQNKSWPSTTKKNLPLLAWSHDLQLWVTWPETVGHMTCNYGSHDLQLWVTWPKKLWVIWPETIGHMTWDYLVTWHDYNSHMPKSLTILERWCSASCEVTGLALGGKTPSDTPGTTMLALILMRALWVRKTLEAFARRRAGEEVRTRRRLRRVISPTFSSPPSETIKYRLKIYSSFPRETEQNSAHTPHQKNASIPCG